jgi:hypothetical protein
MPNIIPIAALCHLCQLVQHTHTHTHKQHTNNTHTTHTGAAATMLSGHLAAAAAGGTAASAAPASHVLPCTGAARLQPASLVLPAAAGRHAGQAWLRAYAAPLSAAHMLLSSKRQHHGHARERPKDQVRAGHQVVESCCRVVKMYFEGTCLWRRRTRLALVNCSDTCAVAVCHGDCVLLFTTSRYTLQYFTIQHLECTCSVKHARTFTVSAVPKGLSLPEKVGRSTWPMMTNKVMIYTLTAAGMKP